MRADPSAEFFEHGNENAHALSLMTVRLATRVMNLASETAMEGRRND